MKNIAPCIVTLLALAASASAQHESRIVRPAGSGPANIGGPVTVSPGEIAQINAARRQDTGSMGWRQPFMWPATGRISTLFGSQRIYRNGEAGAYHSGTDVAVPAGTPVLAPADGVVILASDHPFLLEGNLLMIDHGMGLNSALMHLSRIVVTPGQAVKRGQIVAFSGATGRVTGAHLHWSLRWRNAKIDPLLVAGPMPGVK